MELRILLLDLLFRSAFAALNIESLVMDDPTASIKLEQGVGCDSLSGPSCYNLAKLYHQAELDSSIRSSSVKDDSEERSSLPVALKLSAGGGTDREYDNTQLAALLGLWEAKPLPSNSDVFVHKDSGAVLYWESDRGWRVALSNAYRSADDLSCADPNEESFGIGQFYFTGIDPSSKYEDNLLQGIAFFWKF